MTMMFEVTAGTPNHREVKTYTSKATAKKFVRGRIAYWREFTGRFNHVADAKLAQVSMEIDGVALETLAVGEVRSWRVPEEGSGVEYVVTVSKVEP